jgi:PAS domain S-box-containing protein
MSDSKPVRILYMEDDAELAHLSQKSLQQKGYVVYVAGNGEEGLAMLEANSYDILLAAHKMPVRSGLDVIRTLASKRALPPTIMLTGQGDERVAVEAMKLGAADYIIKDAEGGFLELLPPVIEQVLHQQRLAEEQKRTEETLRYERDKAQKYLDVARVMFVAIDADQKVTLVNERGCEVLGYKEEEIVGKNWFDAFLPEGSSSEVKAVFEKLLAGEIEPVEYYENPVLTRSGEERVIAWHNTALTDEAGNIVGTISSGEDITERKILEETWKRYEFIANASRDFMTLIDRNHAYEAVNESYCKAHGKTRGEIIGYSVAEVWGEERYLTQIKGNLDKCFAGNNEVHYQAWFEFAALGRRCLDVAYYPYYGEEGTVTHVVVVSRDITERKQMQQSLLRAERMAAMGRLAAALAHEINNPLQAIRGHLDLVLDFALSSDESEECLHVCRQEIGRLTEIAQRMLNFARPAKDTRHPVSIYHLIQQTLALVSKQLQRAHIQVTTDLPADPPLIMVAPDQIVQVLLNLIINAAEVMPAGGLLQIAARAAGDMLVLTLTNNGPSIPEEHIDQIFEPFFTTKPNSTGLGLSISHSIIQQHGGTISVENLRDGQGVTFTITLPIARLAREPRQEAGP